MLGIIDIYVFTSLTNTSPQKENNKYMSLII